jgi:hypothetical protein
MFRICIFAVKFIWRTLSFCSPRGCRTRGTDTARTKHNTADTLVTQDCILCWRLLLSVPLCFYHPLYRLSLLSLSVVSCLIFVTFCCSCVTIERTPERVRVLHMLVCSPPFRVIALDIGLVGQPVVVSGFVLFGLDVSEFRSRNTCG